MKDLFLAANEWLSFRTEIEILSYCNQHRWIYRIRYQFQRGLLIIQHVQPIVILQTKWIWNYGSFYQGTDHLWPLCLLWLLQQTRSSSWKLPRQHNQINILGKRNCPCTRQLQIQLGKCLSTTCNVPISEYSFVQANCLCPDSSPVVSGCLSSSSVSQR